MPGWMAEYDWCVKGRDDIRERSREIRKNIDELRELVQKIPKGNAHDEHEKDQILRGLKIPWELRVVGSIYCGKPDLEGDIEIMALEAQEKVGEFSHMSAEDRHCVKELTQRIRAELEGGSKWDGPATFDRVKQECKLTPTPMITGTPPPGPVKEEYEIVPASSTEEFLDILSMGKLPKKREELI